MKTKTKISLSKPSLAVVWRTVRDQTGKEACKTELRRSGRRKMEKNTVHKGDKKKLNAPKNHTNVCSG